jgi:hypothetical protein
LPRTLPANLPNRKPKTHKFIRELDQTSLALMYAGIY